MIESQMQKMADARRLLTAWAERALPPADIEIELEVLGAMVDRASAAIVFDRLAAEDFYRADARLLFEVRNYLWKAGASQDNHRAAKSKADDLEKLLILKRKPVPERRLIFDCAVLRDLRIRRVTLELSGELCIIAGQLEAGMWTDHARRAIATIDAIQRIEVPREVQHDKQRSNGTPGPATEGAAAAQGSVPGGGGGVDRS